MDTRRLIEETLKHDAAMTAGPWKARRLRVNTVIKAGDDYVMESAHVRTEADAEGIAAFRTAAPELARRLQDAEREIERLAKECKDWKDGSDEEAFQGDLARKESGELAERLTACERALFDAITEVVMQRALAEERAGEIERLKAKIDKAMNALPIDRELTDTEAEVALELVEPVPLSEERIAEIVRYATDPNRGPLPWRCENCGARYAEYVNGCPKCCTGEAGGSHKVARAALAQTAKEPQ